MLYAQNEATQKQNLNMVLVYVRITQPIIDFGLSYSRDVNLIYLHNELWLVWIFFFLAS